MTDVVLITAQPRVVSTGSTTTVRLAGGGNRKGYRYQSNHWQAGVVRLPRFATALGFDQNGWTGGSIPAVSSIIYMPARQSILDTLAAYYWPEASLTVQVGDEETETFETVLTGTVENISIADGKLTIAVADLAKALNKPIVTERFEGTGGIEGGDEAKGRVKRRNYGRVFNVEGRVLDKANNIYEFGDLEQSCDSFVAIRDKGRAGDFTSIVTWQGSAAATLTALAAASPDDGEGVAAPSISCVKWWTQPAGPLTADIKGDNSGSYVETVAAIADRIRAVVGASSFDDLSAAIALRTAAAGIHIGTAEETAAQAMNRLFLGSGLLWALSPAGEIVVRVWTFTSPVASLRSVNVERASVLKPVHKRRLGYQRNERQHNDGEIASALSWSDVIDDDGTKPEDNADVTKTLTGTSTITIKRDYQGTPKSSQFNIVRNFYLKTASDDLSEDASWSVSSVTGYTMSITDGVLTITAVSAAASDASIVVTATYNSIAYSHVVQFTFQDDAPPASGGGGVNSASFSGPTGLIYEDLTGAIEITTTDSSVNIAATLTHPYTSGAYVTMKVEYSATGSGGWTDVGSESVGDPGSNGGGTPGEPEPEYPGYVAVNVNKTGLSVGVSAFFRVRAKRSSGSGALGSGNVTVTP